MSYKFLFVL